MRIGYLTSQYPAPSHTFIRREVDALRKRGVEIRTYSARPPSATDRLSEVDRRHHSATFYILPPSLGRLLGAHITTLLRRPVGYIKTLALSLSHRPPGLWGVRRSVCYFIEAIYLAGQLERDGIEHLHNHFANPAANVGLLATRLLKLPWSLTLHAHSEFDYPAGVMLPDKLRAADFVACVSYFVRAQAMRMIEPWHWSKFIIVRCGIEADQLPRPATRSQGPLRILNVARLSPEKGLYGLMEAFATVSREIDCDLVVLGSGPERERLMRRAVELGIESRLRLPGQATEQEVFEEMARADIFVNSSFMEGVPVTLMEALGMRVSAIAPRLTGVPELVKDEITGLLFSPGDWDELTHQLRRLLRDPALRRKLGRAGHDLVVDQFNVDRAVEPLSQRFRDLAPPRIAHDRCRQVAIAS